MKNTVILYHTLGCHLCDEALALVTKISHEEHLNIRLEMVDIVQDNELLSTYGERIPVLKREEGEELCYPFNPKTLADWLKSA